MPLNYKKKYGRYKNYYFRLQSLSREPVAQTSFVLIASLLTISFFGIFAIKPTFATIATLLKEIKNKKELNQKLQAKITALNKAENTYAQITPKLKIINNALPKHPEFTRLEQEIEYLIYKNNLLLASGDFSGFTVVGEKEPEKKKEEEDIDGTLKRLSFNLVIAGEYNDLKNFLKDLENLDRIILVETTSFLKNTDIKGARLQMMLKAKVFYLKPPKI